MAASGRSTTQPCLPFTGRDPAGDGAEGYVRQARQDRLDRRDERRHRATQRGREVIGRDTHVIVRYVMQDDPRQASQATRLIESLTLERPRFPSLPT